MKVEPGSGDRRTVVFETPRRTPRQVVGGPVDVLATRAVPSGTSTVHPLVEVMRRIHEEFWNLQGDNLLVSLGIPHKNDKSTTLLVTVYTVRGFENLHWR